MEHSKELLKELSKKIVRIEKKFDDKGFNQTVSTGIGSGRMLIWESQKLWIVSVYTDEKKHASCATFMDVRNMGTSFSILYDELKRRKQEAQTQVREALERIEAFASRLETEE